MTTVDTRGGPPPDACLRRDVARKLVYWDGLERGELAEVEGHARECPVCGPRLAVLKRSQVLLEAAGADPRGCPSPEELYDFGRGPGHGPLPVERLTAIQAHTVGCPDCRALLATLESRPPLPLDVADAAPGAEEGPAPRRLRLVLPPLAAAAAVLVAALAWQVLRQPGGAGDGSALATRPGYVYPEAAAVRGLLDGPLYYPRGPVLEGPEGGLLHGLEFEIQAQAGATEYRVRLYRQTEDVFVPGEQISVLRSTSPVVQPPASLSERLTPGGYTWEAWCVVDGLDKPLGRRDFDVVRNPDLLARLKRLESLEEPQQGNSILTLLHGNHLDTDLRAFARGLPPSPERDRFLALPE